MKTEHPGKRRQQFVEVSDILELTSIPPTERFAYGSDLNQFAELRMPNVQHSVPVVVVIHGGCWGEYADVSYSAAVSSALVNEGCATWNLEYRRVHQEGGGFPGTFLDVAHGVDALREAARRFSLDLSRVVAFGHSAGGHLAVWAAARHRIPVGETLFIPDPLRISAVVSVAGIVDLAAFLGRGAEPCSERLLRLMGGSPDSEPHRYRFASPLELLPIGVKQRLIWGSHDTIVPSSLFTTYERRAAEMGDDVDSITLSGAAHHELMCPDFAGWAEVAQTVRSLLC